MPKFGAHILFAQEASRQRPDLFSELHTNALQFGAVGPDVTLFMFDPATNKPELRAGIETALNVLEIVQDIKDKLQEVADLLTRPVDDLADYLSGGLTKDISYTVEAGIEALFLTAKLGITLGVGTINVNNPIFEKLQELPADFVRNPAHAARVWTITATDNFGFPFRMFGHPFTDDGAWKQPEPPGDYANWWWMDMLHYRKTGEFAQHMLATAQGPVQKSYSRGYLTHVAGDISGHPFINSLVGGPFRNHAYRHLVLETLADTWLWANKKRGDILDSRLHKLIDLGDDDARQIANLVLNSMRAVYKAPMVPKLLRNGYPEPGEFLSSYRLLKQYLRLSTSGAVKRPTPPPDSLAEVWEEIKDLLARANPGPPPRWNGDIVQFLIALFSWAGKGLSLLAMIAALPFAVVARLVALAPRWVIYLINLGIFYLISAIRTMLCLTGWGYAGIEDFQSFGFLEGLVRTKYNDPDARYPYQTMPIKPPFFWLFQPDTPLLPFIERSQPELKTTIAMVPGIRGLRPDWMMDPANAMDPAVEHNLRALATATTPADTQSIMRSLYRTNGFGNAVDFSIALLDGRFPIPDLDLDGDRGFGYRGWEVLPPNERYV